MVLLVLRRLYTRVVCVGKNLPSPEYRQLLVRTFFRHLTTR